MAMRFEKEKVSAEGSKMAIGSLGIDSADADPETISAADIALKYL